VVGDHVFRTQNRVNLIVIDKQPQLQYLTLQQAQEHFERGASIWDWASHDDTSGDPDIVLASAGDVVTMEILAAAQILRERVPDLRVRYVNVVDIMSLIRPKDHPHGMSDRYFDELFTDDRDVIFAFHGYPGAVHQVVHGRPHADRFRARGFLDHGTTTTPFDMVVRNRVSRYDLVMDALNNARRTVRGSEALYAWCERQLERHHAYVVEHLEDLPQVRDWSWGAPIELPD
jgi:xylulose-5-phosphate/fructose-6-phosphate phosphoketolase